MLMQAEKEEDDKFIVAKKGALISESGEGW